MKWLLLVIVANAPVKTDLVFPTLNQCLLAERDMRAAWVQIYNDAKKREADADSLKFVQNQMAHGTCIPAS
jgi:hypothetical protein